MTYSISFLKPAYKEWDKLPPHIKEQFKKKLNERREIPRIKSAVLHGAADIYKIKLRSSGYRLAYRVIDDRLVIQVVAVGKRDKNAIYKKMLERL